MPLLSRDIRICEQMMAVNQKAGRSASFPPGLAATAALCRSEGAGPWGPLREPAGKQRLLPSVGGSCPERVCAMQRNETKLDKIKDFRPGIRCNRG